MKNNNRWHSYHTVWLASVLIFLSAAIGLLIYDYKAQPAKTPTNSHASLVPSVTSANAPTTSPTITPTTTPTPTVGPPDQFTNLPGFTIAYGSDWTVTQKKFGIKDPGVFISSYFPSCHEGCMGIRLSKGDISLDLLFDKAYDSAGIVCSNTASYEGLSNGWYRIKDSKGYFYSKTVTLNQHIDGEKYPQNSTSNHEWEMASGMDYAICKQGAGTFIELHNPPDNFQGPGILLEFPKVRGNPDSAQLAELDAIVTSIKGLGRY